MRYTDIQKLEDIQFKRLTGITWSTFKIMLIELNKHIPTKGRPSILSLEDQLLLCLSYWREYRILFHIGVSYGVSEATASRIVRHVEDCLTKSKLFNLHKRIPAGSELDWNVVIVDATEITVQRPKKTKEKL
ncbi:transposase family protein [Acinetobacter sp. WCHAc060033]|uniref:transposase family protein n=1 Tax=Acinetobacter sp. WCHAc060033 TaxID=2518624 RepID=UPI0010232ED8|nr:transposase family protein [Acinetobacter sp. WCHAc060033]RZG88414.1 transposase family protein [Acinetobacter sp. WCHAc060033]